VECALGLVWISFVGHVPLRNFRRTSASGTLLDTLHMALESLPAITGNGVLSLASKNHSNDAFSLENILGENHESVQYLGSKDGLLLDDSDEDILDQTAPDGYCVECEGTDYSSLNDFSLSVSNRPTSTDSL
jgi:hypothetical protein